MSWTALHSSFTSRSCGCSVGSAWQLKTLVSLVLCSLMVTSLTSPGVALAETEATEATEVAQETQPPFLSSEGAGTDPAPSLSSFNDEVASEPVLVTDPDLAAAVSDLAAAVATLQDTRADFEGISNVEQLDGPSDSEQESAIADSGPLQRTSEGETSGTQTVVVRDDAAKIREFDYEAPECILYAGLGLCCGAVLGLVFTLGVSTNEQRGVNVHE